MEARREGTERSGERCRAMFVGSWTNKVDDKGRLFLPRRLVTSLHASYGERPDLILTRRPDQPCLVLQSVAQWEKQRRDLSRLHPLSREYATFMRFAALAQPVEWDQQYRVLLDPSLRELCGIKTNSDVMLLGCGDYVELWDEEAGRRVLRGLVDEGPQILDAMLSRLSNMPEAGPEANNTPELANNKHG